MDKQKWIDGAEIFDSWRVVPRLFLFGFWITTFTFIFYFSYWYFHLPANERGYEESGAMTAIIIALLKFGKDVYDTYTQNGRDWNNVPKVDP